MLAGVLELQIFAGLARLSDDMRRAEKIVQDSTDKMGRAVGNLESAFGKLGSTLALGVAFDQVRRLTDDYTKLTAQLRIATHSQAEYALGLSEVRRISTLAQADINATAMLYTRLANSLGGYGATQKQVGTITEAVSLGLKAYGATAVEAASSMLQLSQAFASNRLGGDEFRSLMESMPNMMRVLAKSMGVPYEALKVLSAEGKITSKEMMKAWDDPALIASLLKQAEMTRTISGEMAVFRNNLKMLVGEFMGTSKGTQGITSVLHLMSDAVVELSKHISDLATGATALVAVLAGKALLALKTKIQVMWVYNEALAMNAAGVKAHAEMVMLSEAQEMNAAFDTAKARKAAAAIKAQAAAESTMAMQAEAAAVKASSAVIKAAAKEEAIIVKAAKAEEVIAIERVANAYMLGAGTQAKAAMQLAAAEVERTAIMRAELTAQMAHAEAAAERQRVINNTRATQDAARYEAQWVEAIAMNAMVDKQIAAQAALAAAAEARAAAEIGALAKVGNFIKGMVGGTLGLIGLALWGAYEIADHLGWIDKIFNTAEGRMKQYKILAEGHDANTQGGRAANAFIVGVEAARAELVASEAATKAMKEEKKIAAELGISIDELGTVRGRTIALEAEEIKLQRALNLQTISSIGTLGDVTDLFGNRARAVAAATERVRGHIEALKALQAGDQRGIGVMSGIDVPAGSAERWAALQQAHQTEAYKTAQLEIEKQKILTTSYERQRDLGKLSIADQKDRSAEIRAIQKEAQGQIADLYEKNKVAEKELSTFEKMSLKNAQRLAELQLELNGNSKLLQSEKDIADFREAQAHKKTGMSAPHQAISLAELEQIKLDERLLRDNKLQAEAIGEINAAGLTELDRLDKAIAAQRLHNDSIGKSAEEVAKLKAIEEERHLAKLEADAKMLADSFNQDAAVLATLDNLDKQIAKEKEFAALKAAAAPREAIKAAEHEQKKLAESFTKHFNDAFSSVFTSGKSMFARLGEAFSASFKDVLSAFNKPMLDKFSAGGADVVQSLSRSPMIASAMPYVAAAMLAMPVIGSLFSHQASAAQLNQVNPQYIQQWQGTGTVLGDIAAKSTSVAGSLDMLNKTTFAHTDYLAQMTTSMKSVDKGLSNFITVAGKALNLNMASQTPLGTTTSQNLSGGANFLLTSGLTSLLMSSAVGTAITGAISSAIASSAVAASISTGAISAIGSAGFMDALSFLGGPAGIVAGLVLAPMIGSLLGGLFGSSSTSITGTGINFGGTTKQLQQGQGGQQYTSGVTSESSWFGLSSSSSTWTQYAALDAKVTKAMGDIFKNIGDTIKVAGTVLGGNLATLTQQVDAFVITTGNISMAGLTVQQQQDALSSIISKQSDLMVAAIVPTMKAFQVAGEGLLQTLVRVVSEIATLSTFYRVLGDTTLVSAASADKLITALGGVDAANQSMTKFVSNFAPETTKSALALNALEVALSNAGLRGIAPLIKTTQDYFALMQVASADQRVILLQQQDTALAYIKSIGSAMNLMLDQASKQAGITKNELGFVITNLSSLASSLKGAAQSLYQSFMQQMTPDYQRQQYKASLALLQDAYTNYKATGVAPNAASLQQAVTNVSQGGTQMFTSAVDWKRSTIQTIDLLSGMGNLADAQVTVLTQISGTMDKLLAANQEQLAAINAGNLAAAADAANRAAALSVNLQWLQGVNTLVTNSAAQNTLVIDLVKQTVSATSGGSTALIDTLQKYITASGTTMIGSGATTGVGGATSSAGGVLANGTVAGALNQVAGMSALGNFSASGIVNAAVAPNAMNNAIPGIQASNAAAVIAAQQAAATTAATAAANAAIAKAAHKAFDIANPAQGYLIDNPDVANYNNWHGTPYQHWTMYGKTEGRSWAGSPGSAGLDSFAVGANALLRDGPVFAHAGEEIKPAAYVDKDKGARTETNALLARLVASNDASRTELVSVRKELADIRRTNQNMDWTADKWDNTGMPAVRV